jgi:hypothetical protein
MNRIFTLIALLFTLNSYSQSQITWMASSNVASSTYDNNHPRIVLDGSGNPLLVWGRMSDGSAFFSRWTGSAFSTPVKLNPSWMTVANGSWMGPQIAAYGDTMYVVMKRTPEASDTNHVYLVRSFDGGMTFSAPTRVDYIADSISRFPTLTTDAIGNPIVAFMKFNPSFLNARWVVAKSTDYGNSFSADVMASGWSNGDVCDCCPGVIQCSGNTVTMLYRDNLSDIRDSWTGLSTDGGTSFNDGWNIDGNNWFVPACPASGPDGEIAGDSLYAVYMNGASGTFRVYRSVSSISGGNRESDQLITGNIANLNEQNYPRMSRFGSAFGIVWKQVVNSSDQLPILFTNNISNGYPANYDTVDLANITNADIAVGNGTVVVIWEDNGSGTVKYRMGTYTPSTTNIHELTDNSFSVYPNPAQNILTLQTKGRLESGKIRIMNSLGVTEFEKTVSINGSAELDISALESGFYFLEFLGQSRCSVMRFTKE